MKRYRYAAALFLYLPLTVTAATAAGFDGPQEFHAMTAAQARLMRDDVWITLCGVIEKDLGNGYYAFRDDSGTIALEARRVDLHVQPGITVEIRGTVDCRVGSTHPIYVKVDRITPVKSGPAEETP